MTCTSLYHRTNERIFVWYLKLLETVVPGKRQHNAGIIHTCKTLKVNGHHVPTSQAWYKPLEIPLAVNTTHSANACIKQVAVNLAIRGQKIYEGWLGLLEHSVIAQSIST